MVLFSVVFSVCIAGEGPVKGVRHLEDGLFLDVGSRAGYEKELFALLVQLVRDMDRKIERQKERAQRESEPRLLSSSEQAQLDAVTVRTVCSCLWAGPSTLVPFSGSF